MGFYTQQVQQKRMHRRPLIQFQGGGFGLGAPGLAFGVKGTLNLLCNSLFVLFWSVGVRLGELVVVLPCREYEKFRRRQNSRKPQPSRMSRSLPASHNYSPILSDPRSTKKRLEFGNRHINSNPEVIESLYACQKESRMLRTPQQKLIGSGDPRG